MGVFLGDKTGFVRLGHKYYTLYKVGMVPTEYWEHEVCIEVARQYTVYKAGMAYI